MNISFIFNKTSFIDIYLLDYDLRYFLINSNNNPLN